MPSAYAAVPDGYIVKVDSATVYLDWGKSSGVAAGDRFRIYRPGEPLKHPVTGEVLGRAEEDFGQGVIETIEEKFSTGKLVETKGPIQPGDRTRCQEPVVTPAPGPVAVATAAAVSVPKELWRSDALPREAVGLALGDVDGDGKKDVVVAFRDQIEVFRWNGQKLESLAVFKGHGYRNFLAVETADIDGAGHDKIFASLFYEGVKRLRTVVLDYSQGALREVGNVGGFVRAFEHAAPDGKRELLLQDMSMSREFRVRQPAALTKVGQKFREGKALNLGRGLNDDQLFGFTRGDWDGDGTEDLALLQNGERLRIFFKDAKWSSGQAYGGTQADFTWENDQAASVYPRLLNWRPAAGKMQLLVPHNISFTPIRFARLKIYKNSEIIDLAWNGLEMAPVWTLPVAGATADMAAGDALQRGESQLWVASVGAGDKTVLIAFQIP